MKAESVSLPPGTSLLWVERPDTLFRRFMRQQGRPGTACTPPSVAFFNEGVGRRTRTWYAHCVQASDLKQYLRRLLAGSLGDGARGYPPTLASHRPSHMQHAYIHYLRLLHGTRGRAVVLDAYMDRGAARWLLHASRCSYNTYPCRVASITLGQI